MNKYMASSPIWKLKSYCTKSFKNWAKTLAYLLLVLAVGPLQAQKKKEEVDPVKKVQAERLFLEGLQFFWTDRPLEALRAWEEVTRLDPTQGSTFFFIGKTHASLAQWDQAKTALEKAAQLAPENKFIPEEYGNVLVQLGKIKEAISVYEKLNARYPTNPTWYFRLIDLWQQENKPQEVLRTIAQVEKIIGVTEETTRQKQVIYLQQNQVEKIFQASDALIASEPKEIEFVLQKAQMQMAANRWEDASRTLQNLIAQHPSASKAYSLLISIAVIQEDDKMLAQWIRQILPQRNISLSDVSPFLRQALAAQKIEESEQLYTLLKTRIEPANTPAVEYSLAGFWALSIERWSEAQTFLQKSLDLDPNDLSNWQALMEADKQMSALDVLIQHADQATTYFPAEPSFWYQLGWGLYYQKKNQEALEALQEVLRIPSASKTQKAYSHALIGDIYHAMKRFGPSDQAYDAALTLDPTLAQALNNFSYFSALRKENLELAEVRAKKLIDLYPNIPGYLDTYAWVLVQQGKWDQALPWLEKAVSIESGVSATVWEHLGDVYDFLKLPEKAKIAWEKARSLGGNTSQLNQKLAQ